MDSSDYTSLVLYHGRIHFYHSMQKAALDGLGKFPTQASFRLFNGIALALGNRIQEGIRELNPLKADPELGLCAVLALLYAHQRCSVVDTDTLFSLERRLAEEREQLSSANAAYYAAVFLFFTGKLEEAREMADRAVKLDGQHDFALIMKCWADLSLSASVSGNVLNTLERILGHSKNIDASLAQVHYYQKGGQFENAVGVLNKLSVRFPELNIPLIAKMQTQLAAYDWDHAYETALRIINLEPMNIQALQVKALLLLVRESNFKAGLATLQHLFKALERVEVGNNNLLLQTCRLFARVCCRNGEILFLLIRSLDRITQLSSCAIDYLTELGYERYLAGNAKEAMACFRTANKMDANSFQALCGLTLCQIADPALAEQTRQQIQLLNEMNNGTGEKEPLLLYLTARQAEQSDRAIALLVEATELHLQPLRAHIFGADYLSLLNPDFLLQIATELLRHSPWEVRIKRTHYVSYESLHITLKQSIMILELIVRSCPGHVRAIFMRAKVEFLCGEVTSASLTLQRILGEFDSTFMDAYLLLAEIQMQGEQFAKAQQSLEMALSHNFGVREKPLYHLMMGMIQKQQRLYAEAQKSLQTALQIVQGHADSEANQTVSPFSENTNTICEGFTLADKVTLYLELMATLRELADPNGLAESERLLQTAIEEFAGTPEEGRIVIAHADMMVQNCNYPKAIALLTAVRPGQSYYIQAKTHLANIYLEHRKDRVAFAKCFKELVEACPETESYLMLGEAYMSIQEPDLAVEAYQNALDLNPNDSLLASKLGRSYVKTHQYNKAIQYYQDALKNPDHSGLKLDLAELYLKLKQFNNAASILNADDAKITDHDVASLQLRTKELLLLARVYEKSGNVSMSLKTLHEARDNQYRVQKRISVDQSGNLHEQYKLLAKICLLMATQSINVRDNEQALKSFKECIKYTPNDIEILASLARLYMQMNQMEQCRDICMQILQIDSNNEAASVMMADLSFRKIDFESAAFHFSQLLTNQPCYWTALARLIEVMRRSGTLNDANSFLMRAEQEVPHAVQNSGLNYCKGLFEWYSGNPNGALRHFNAVRRDYEWGQQAIYNMIEICINPDGDIPNSADVQEAMDSGDFSESRIIALRTAERLLKELRPRSGGMDNEALNHRLLHNFLKLASKQKFQIESALADFTELATREEYQNMVGPVLGMASAFVCLKQVQRAKNQLKRISRVPWNFEESEYLERSWLLLADIYINASKLDVAEGFVSRALEHNKSCTKAFELAGYIAEKSQMYRDAAKHYLNAWNYGARAKPHIGYKLAFNYMKTKKYAHAIDICQQVIKMHPDYTIIRKDILDKCRYNLRP